MHYFMLQQFCIVNLLQLNLWGASYYRVVIKSLQSVRMCGRTRRLWWSTHSKPYLTRHALSLCVNSVTSNYVMGIPFRLDLVNLFINDICLVSHYDCVACIGLAWANTNYAYHIAKAFSDTYFLEHFIKSTARYNLLCSGFVFC